MASAKNACEIHIHIKLDLQNILAEFSELS